MANKNIKLKDINTQNVLYPQTKTSLLINDDGSAANIENKINSKLDKTAKAADSELLDGKDSLYFNNAIETTYADLKAKRDVGQLVKGQWYRITDYKTMVDQPGLTSADHQFDLIVLATDINSLNENVFAALHSGDTYFANNNLNAWKINYTINNDKAIYSWANASGKGIIYALEDEFGNSFPYDFKNILVNGEPILGENCKNVKVESKDFYIKYINTIDKTNNNIQNIHVYSGLKGNSAEFPKVIQVPEHGDTLLEIKPQNSLELINPAPDINYYYDDNLAPDAQNKPFNGFAGTTEDLFNVLSDGGNEHKWTDMSNMFRDADLIESIPLIDTSNVTNMNRMFRYCSSLKEIPLLNTNKVTNMESIFNFCTSLTTIPQLDTSKVTNMQDMFGGCSSLTSIPKLDTSNVTNMGDMFYICDLLQNIPLLNTSNVTNMVGMFQYCSSLTTIPLLDTSNVTNMWGMFYDCSSLTTIPLLDVSNVTNMWGIFNGCTSLTEIHMININADLDISDTILEHDALVELIGNLMPQENLGTPSKTLTLGPTLKAKLSAAEIQVATNKGWTL